jgi:transposase
VPFSKVELYASIRHDAQVEGLSSRALSAKYGVGRRTVAMALESVWPAPRKQLPARVSRLDAFKATIDQILRDDLDAPRKQRHTVKRVFDRLIDEHDAHGVTYSMVRANIFQRTPEIRIEAGRGPPQAFVPQTHRPGDEAEVDFGDVWIHLNGVPTKVFLFSLRLSFSGKAVHEIFASCGQEAFLEGHVHALQVLGGVLRGKVRYNSLRAAVSQVLGRTRGRVESDRWTAFRSYFAIESFYCNPGIEGAHEKGGVEGQIGWFRRNHLVPVPKVASLAELNAMVERWDKEDDGRRIMQRALTIGEMFAVERPLLVPLPEEDFETGLVSSLRVDRYGQVGVRTNHYSVPVRLIGRMVRVVLHASELVVHDAHREVARHERLIAQKPVSIRT